jgi:integrase
VARRRGESRRANPKFGLVSAATVNRTLTQLLRRILTRARKKWRIPLPAEPDWAGHILKEPAERTRELRFDEEAAIETAERNDYRPARLFAQATGLRRREVVSLTWSQVDWGAEIIRVVQKGDKPHVIPITPEVAHILWPLRGHHETRVLPLSPNGRGHAPKAVIGTSGAPATQSVIRAGGRPSREHGKRRVSRTSGSTICVTRARPAPCGHRRICALCRRCWATPISRRRCVTLTPSSTTWPKR